VKLTEQSEGELLLNQDYTVTYSDAVNAGTVDVTITGKGNYADSVSSKPTFTITKGTATAPTELEAGTVTDKEINVSVKNPNDAYTYEYAIVTKGTAAPDDSAYSSANNTTGKFDTGINADTEYTVYCRVKKASTPDNYDASTAISLDVKTAKPALNASYVTVSLGAVEDLTSTGTTYTGSKIEPTVKVTSDGSSSIIAEANYDVQYQKETATAGTYANVTEVKGAGNYKVIVTGKEDYSGTVEKEFTVKPKEITGVATSFVETTKTYDSTATVQVNVALADNAIASGDTVSLATTVMTGTLAGPAVDTGVALSSVTVPDENVLTGADAANYKLTTVDPNGLTIDIVKATSVEITGTGSYTIAVGQTFTLDTTSNVGAKLKATLEGEGADLLDSKTIDIKTDTDTGKIKVELKKYISLTGLSLKVVVDPTDPAAAYYDATGVSKTINLTFEEQTSKIEIKAQSGWDSTTNTLTVASSTDESGFKSAVAAKVYYVSDNATPATETENSTGSSAIKYKYDGSDTYNSEDGVYTVTISYAGDPDNHITADTKTITLVIGTISKKDLTIKVKDLSWKIGTTEPAASDYDYEATVTTDTKVTLSDTAAPTYKICETGTTNEVQLSSITTAGTYDIVATFGELGTKDALQYTLDAANVKVGKLTVTEHQKTAEELKTELDKANSDLAEAQEALAGKIDKTTANQEKEDAVNKALEGMVSQATADQAKADAVSAALEGMISQTTADQAKADAVSAALVGMISQATADQEKAAAVAAAAAATTPATTTTTTTTPAATTTTETPVAAATAVGDTVKIDGNTYTVTDVDKKTVSFTAVKKNAASAYIVSTVTIGGVDFKVTAIAKNAFKGDTKLTSVTIPTTVKTIGDSAFSGCTKLTSIVIPKNVTSIGKQAFYKCSKLKKVTIKSTKLTKIGSKAFTSIAKKATITVRPRRKRLTRNS
jgi:hypothetical protein